jgi:hypothetical protein
LQVILQVLEVPHVAFYLVRAGGIFCVFYYWIVWQVRVSIREIFKVKVTASEPHVGFCIHPNCEWVPVCNKNPLSDIKFAAFGNQTSLNVLLNYVLSFYLLAHIQYLN